MQIVNISKLTKINKLKSWWNITPLTFIAFFSLWHYAQTCYFCHDTSHMWESFIGWSIFFFHLTKSVFFPQKYKGDPRTYTIFIPGWGSNQGSAVFSVFRITMVRQVGMYWGLSVKISTRKTLHSAPGLWTHLFCVWGWQKLKDPQFEPYGWRRPLHGAVPVYKVWDLPCIYVVSPCCC